MKKLESGAGKLRVIVQVREPGKKGRSRSQALVPEDRDEIIPDLDDCLEAAMNAVLRLANQRPRYE